MGNESTQLVLSKNINNYMAMYNITQSDLARMLGVSPAGVRGWMKGRRVPKMKYIDEMCKIFHCSQGDLVTADAVFEASTKDVLVEQIVDKASHLSDEGKQKVIDYIDDISERFKR